MSIFVGMEFKHLILPVIGGGLAYYYYKVNHAIDKDISFKLDSLFLNEKETNLNGSVIFGGNIWVQNSGDFSLPLQKITGDIFVGEKKVGTFTTDKKVHLAGRSSQLIKVTVTLDSMSSISSLITWMADKIGGNQSVFKINVFYHLFGFIKFPVYNYEVPISSVKVEK